MTLFQAIILAIVQGITEFLPVSSSGHLVLFQKIFQLSQPPVFYDIVLHLGTLMAIVFFLKKDLILLIRNWRENINVWLFVVVGTIPAAVIGFFLNSQLVIVFNSLILVGSAWIIFGLSFLWSKKISKKNNGKGLGKAGIKDGLIVGLFQSAALLPGISRAGSTIMGAFSRNFSSEAAFSLSFLLAIPAILGATVLSWPEADFNQFSLNLGLVGLITSFGVGYFSLKLLKRVLLSEKLYLFGFYCLVIGLAVLIFKI